MPGISRTLCLAKPLRASCHRNETLEYQGFMQQREPGASGIASMAKGFETIRQDSAGLPALLTASSRN
jgi:hypothetical protein